MPRNLGQPDPVTWKAIGNAVWLERTRRTRAGSIDRRTGDTYVKVADVLIAGPPGAKLAAAAAEALNAANIQPSALREFRRARGAARKG